jgi:hypothetical protein
MNASDASKVVVATVGYKRDVALLQACVDLQAIAIAQRMIQDRNGQGAVFDRKQGFVESAGPCDPRSLVLKCERHIKRNERLVLGDQDKASCQRAIHGFTIGAAKARLLGQRDCRLSEAILIGVDQPVYECPQEMRRRLRIALLLGGRPASHVFDFLAGHVFQLAGLVDGFVTHLARLLLGAHVSRPFRGFETWRRLELLL